MKLHGLVADAQPVGNHAVGEPEREEVRDLALAWRQRLSRTALACQGVELVARVGSGRSGGWREDEGVGGVAGTPSRLERRRLADNLDARFVKLEPQPIPLERRADENHAHVVRPREPGSRVSPSAVHPQ